MKAEEKTIASEILKKHLVSFMDGSKRSEDEDLQIIYKCALLAMEEYAQLKLSEHSTKEQEIIQCLKTVQEAIKAHKDGVGGFKEPDWNENYMINIGLTVKECRIIFELVKK